MRSGFSAYILFVIVITFIVLFTGYLCISINQTKAFGVKNEIVNIIEKYKEDFPKHIPEALNKVGYHNTGRCDDDFIGYDREGNEAVGGTAAICVKAIENNNGQVKGYYYKVVTFYQLDLPIIKTLFNLKSEGETKTIYSRNEYGL